MTDQRLDEHRRCADCAGPVVVGRWRCDGCQSNRRPLTRDVDAAGRTRLRMEHR